MHRSVGTGGRTHEACHLAVSRPDCRRGGASAVEHAQSGWRCFDDHFSSALCSWRVIDYPSEHETKPFVAEPGRIAKPLIERCLPRILVARQPAREFVI